MLSNSSNISNSNNSNNTNSNTTNNILLDINIESERMYKNIDKLCKQYKKISAFAEKQRKIFSNTNK
ncbi:hypothetical protein EHP00_2441 [Ecytonucleospora hepatopenaei]|uniref:Uncharacterized protein n=1 Tax=Ecytonucleospora hepatopenaei TaxID=646526 RepID=A0A1W0E2V8_9MICR|nr:hypothetical protein EHP00_2441 [Ecytonucleospora hepatopenaei]